MGTKLDDDNYVILVDVDNKNGTVDKWLDLLKQHQKTTKIKTPTAITGNDGIHYLFKVPSELYKNLQNAYTGLNVDGLKLDIDIKCDNGLQLAEPTKYKSLDGTTKAYTWHKDSIYKYDIMTLPTWLYKIIIKKLF